MANVVIDPVTRIEGHLRIEAQVDGGKVTSAWSSGTMFRGMELILQGRDPREAWIWAQRICGVCTTVHAHTSVYAVENALGIEVPPNARIIRNLIAGAQHIQDHVIHFYHLHALDWVDVVASLKADPAATAKIAQSISAWPLSSEDYFAGVQARVKKLVDSGQLSLMASGYWGHPAYLLPPEYDLLAVAHYLEALEWQREVIKIHSVLGGKNPHLQTYLVGGMAAAVDPNSPNVINWERIDFMAQRIKQMRDVRGAGLHARRLAVGGFPGYADWWSLGAGHKNYMSYGGLQDGLQNEEAKFGFPRGIILGGDLTTVHPARPDQDHRVDRPLLLHVRQRQESALHPWSGETNPKYTGPTPPYDALATDEQYSWLKAPRYDGQVMEVGPLARMLVAYGSGNAGGQGARGRRPDRRSRLRRRRCSRRSAAWPPGCSRRSTCSTRWTPGSSSSPQNMESGDLRIHDGSKWDPSTWPAEAEGWGFHEAPRGALGHWIKIKDKKIVNYQAVVPSTWNAGPRDEQGQTGPYEASLEGTPVADPTQPLELLRTIHSFDPCLACAVHVVDATGEERVRVEVR